MPSLADLTPELICLIAEELSCDDFCILRLTCKNVQTKSLHVFVQRFFQTRCVMLEERSLQNLVSISTHEAFGNAMRSLVICTTHLLSEVSIATQLALPRWETYRLRLEGQKTFLNLGRHVKLLRKAVERLQNCKSIILTATEVWMDSDVATTITGLRSSIPAPDRLRGLDSSLMPWGAGQLERDTGVGPHGGLTYVGADESMFEESKDFIRLALDTTLEIVNVATNVESLHIYVGEPNVEVPISLGCVIWALVPQREALKKLKSLTLLVEVGTNYTRSSGAIWQNEQSLQNSFPNLSHLHIQGVCRRVHDWSVSDIPLALYLPSLESLHLENLPLTAERFTSIIHRHRENRLKVTLRQAYLLGTGWSQLRKDRHTYDLVLDQCPGLAEVV